MKARLTYLTVILATFGWVSSSPAQMPSPATAGLNAAMTKLFGDFNAFSAKAEARLLDENQKESMRVPMNFALLDGKMRAEVNLGLMKSQLMPAEALANLKQMGMDQMVTIVRPDLKSTCIVYPALKAYAMTPMPILEVKELEQRYSISKTKLGKEKIDGHSCEKSRVIISGGKGEKREALVWYAQDLKGFPIQIQMTDSDSTLVMVYREVKLVKPETSAFEAPAGFTKHASIEALMQAAMMKMFGGQK